MESTGWPLPRITHLVARLHGWEDAVQGPYTPDRERLQIAARNLDDAQLAESAIPSYLHSNSIIQGLFEARGNIVTNWILSANPRDVVDLGCGAGILIDCLHEHGIETTVGLDSVPAAASAYLDADKGEILRGDVCQLPLESNSFDVAVAMDVLEHLDTIERAVDEIQRILRPSGLLIVSGPTESRLYKAGRIVAGFSDDYHSLTVAEVEQTIEDKFSVYDRRELKVGGRLFRLTAYSTET